MTRPRGASQKVHPPTRWLTVKGSAWEMIQTLDTPEKCADFYVNAQEPYKAMQEVWKHVRSMLQLTARERPLVVNDGQQVVINEPSDYDYDVGVVKEFAPECMKMVEVATSDKMKRINEIAGGIYELGIGDQPIPPDAIKEIMQLSQPETREVVNGQKLAAVLAKGDARAVAMITRGVKKPVSFKLAIKEVPVAGSKEGRP